MRRCKGRQVSGSGRRSVPLIHGGARPDASAIPTGEIHQEACDVNCGLRRRHGLGQSSECHGLAAQAGRTPPCLLVWWATGFSSTVTTLGWAHGGAKPAREMASIHGKDDVSGYRAMTSCLDPVLHEQKTAPAGSTNTYILITGTLLIPLSTPLSNTPTVPLHIALPGLSHL
ncbi:hypothetical protein BD309DRAFT_957216 [Dichomitus squalens]|nr:hypothetical protein BD309DRAFT_957216 [Dichomitus squalens]